MKAFLLLGLLASLGCSGPTEPLCRWRYTALEFRFAPGADTATAVPTDSTLVCKAWWL